MGEVYRADDLLLGQAVALKFLPEGLTDDPSRLRRFYEEVRIARQITHPAVCRTHDVFSAGAQPFLSMEYVDGEDLKSLLRRIGRLPNDKALEIARQLCAGLAAAHERGVLHRDLKPDNVMIDGQGKVRITDFGLAAVAETIEGHDVRSGTPAYMAPEQLAGHEVTIASDVYALGLVLYELFTGRRAFSGKTMGELMQQHADSDVAHPSTIVSDIEVGVERVILACLAKDATQRPVSALAVAAALPGGDPLAAALAAGETPSPELVAAAGRTEGLGPTRALGALAFAIVGLIAIPILSSDQQLIRWIPLDLPPAVLESRANQILERAGYTAEWADSKTGITIDQEYFRHVRATDDSLTRWDGLATGRPPVFFFWTRHSPQTLVPTSAWGVVGIQDPPRWLSGMTLVIVDGEGQLVELEVVPPQIDASDQPIEPVGPVEPDWARLFEEAGLDIARFAPAPSRWTPPRFADTRAAWIGSYPERPDEELRVEAAGYRGRAIYFRLFGEWSRAWQMSPSARTAGQTVASAIMGSVLFITITLAAFLARRNWKVGRGDRRGARRLAWFAGTATLISWALSADHTFETSELGLFYRAASLSLFGGVMVWVLYLAIEPYVRRHFPHRLTSWNRLLSGAWRDPLVGRDVLLGACVGAGMACVIALYTQVPRLLGYPSAGPNAYALDTLLGNRFALSGILDMVVQAVAVGMGFMLVVLLLRLALRRESLAAVALIGLMGTQSALSSELSLWISLSFGLLVWSIPTIVLLRNGLLTTITGLLVIFLVGNFPITSRVDDWTGLTTTWSMAFVAGIAVWGFWTALGDHSLFGAALDS
jgi:serine/threonine-protein kinase